MSRKFLTIFLSMFLIFALPLSSFATTLSDFSDAPASGDWSQSALDYAVQYDLLRGINGKIEGQGQLTRAQMATVMNRAFGATAKADITHFTDVSSTDWFYDDMAKAYQMGSLTGRSATTMAPNEPISRQEVFTVFARLLALTAGPSNVLDGFSDGNTVAAWAKNSVTALVDRGIVGGANGRLYPTNTITRAEFAALMQKTFPTIVRSAEDLASVKSGNVLISAHIKELKELAIHGDLFFGDGIGDNEVILAGKVDGRLVARGANPIDTRGLTVEEIVINDPNLTTTLKVEHLKKLEGKTLVEVVEGTVESASGKTIAKDDGKILNQGQDSDQVKDKVEDEDQDQNNDKTDENKDEDISQDSVYYKPDSSSSHHHHGKESNEDEDTPITPKPEPQNLVLFGDANVDQRQYPIVHPYVRVPFFNAHVKVELNVDGTIKTVSDDNTSEKGWDPNYDKDSWEHANGRYWNRALKSDIWGKFSGKDRAAVAAMKMEHDEADVVAGATECGKAIREAVLNALDKKPGKAFLKVNETLSVGDVQDAGASKYAQETAEGYEVTFNNTLPNDYQVKLHSVYQSVYNGEEETKIAEEAVEWIENSDGSFTLKLKGTDFKPGKYFVNIIDEAGKYRSPDFETRPFVHHPFFEINKNDSLSYSEVDSQMTVSDGDIANFNRNIKEIVVTELDANGEPIMVEDDGEMVPKSVEIEPVNSHGRKRSYHENPLFKENGALNKEMTYGHHHPRPLFEPGKSYRVFVDSFGYGTTQFDYAPPGRTIESDANVDLRDYPDWNHDNLVAFPYFNVRIKVYLDDHNQVTGVIDNRTGRSMLSPNGDYRKWREYNSEFVRPVFRDETFMNQFIGINEDEVLALMKRIDTTGEDAVSGATQTCGAIAEAVLRAKMAPDGVTEVHGRQFLPEPMVLSQISDTEYGFGQTFPDGFVTDNDNVSIYHGVFNRLGEPLATEWNQEEKKISLQEPLSKPGLYIVNIKDISGPHGLGTWRSPNFRSDDNSAEFPHIIVPFENRYSFENGVLRNATSGEQATKEEVALINKNIKSFTVKAKEQEEGNKFWPVYDNGTAEELYLEKGPLFIEEGDKLGHLVNEPLLFEPGKVYEMSVKVWGIDEPIVFEHTGENAATPTPEPPNPNPPTGDKWFSGSAKVDRFDWLVKLKIQLDADGKIAAIEDDGTDPDGNERWWDIFLTYKKNKPPVNGGYKSKFLGKDQVAVEQMQMQRGSPDVATGATYTSKAAKAAVLNAFAKSKEKP